MSSPDDRWVFLFPVRRYHIYLVSGFGEPVIEGPHNPGNTAAAFFRIVIVEKKYFHKRSLL